MCTPPLCVCCADGSRSLVEGSGWAPGRDCSACDVDGLVCCRCAWQPGLLAVAVAQQRTTALTTAANTTAPVAAAFALPMGAWAALAALGALALLGGALLAALVWYQRRTAQYVPFAPVARFIAGACVRLCAVVCAVDGRARRRDR